MKYTVVLNQSVPNDQRSQLTEHLATRFGLNAEQAAKLASRKPGRLLKPTSKSRAEALAALYQQLNLSVRLEEVAEEPVPAPATVVDEPAAVSARSEPGPAVAEAVAAPTPEPAAVPASPAAAPVEPPVQAAEGDNEQKVVSISTTPTVERTFVDGPAAPVARPRRNASLYQRVLLTTLAPVVAVGVVAVAGAWLTQTQSGAAGSGTGFMWQQIAATVAVLIAAAFFAVRTARGIVAPIEQLVQAADKISLGQLDTPVEVEGHDELAELGRALERMRLSLQAAMERLRKRRNRA